MNSSVQAVITRKNSRKRRSVARLRLMAVAVAAVGSLLLGGGVFAVWAPSATLSTGGVGAANLAVTLVDSNGTQFSTAVANMLPGDYINRYADLTNTGTVAQTFTGTILATGSLGPAMTVKVDTCSVAWASNGTCSGTTTPVVAATPSSPAANIAFPSLAVNSVNRARFQFTLSSTATQGTYQGTTATEAVSLSGNATSGGNSDRTGG